MEPSGPNNWQIFGLILLAVGIVEVPLTGAYVLLNLIFFHQAFPGCR